MHEALSSDDGNAASGSAPLSDRPHQYRNVHRPQYGLGIKYGAGLCLEEHDGGPGPGEKGQAMANALQAIEPWRLGGQTPVKALSGRASDGFYDVLFIAQSVQVPKSKFRSRGRPRSSAYGSTSN